MIGNLTLERFSLDAWIIKGEISKFSTKEPALKKRALRSGLKILDIVYGDECVLLRFTKEVGRNDVESLFINLSDSDTEVQSVLVHEIPVSYDGLDIEYVADKYAMSVSEYISGHSKVFYKVAFMGFAPGFGYLKGGYLDDLPRRESPREKIEAGSLAVAAGYSAIYPIASPGGWHIIGRTEIDMFDLDRKDAILLNPYDEVRFVPV